MEIGKGFQSTNPNPIKTAANNRTPIQFREPASLPDERPFGRRARSKTDNIGADKVMTPAIDAINLIRFSLIIFTNRGYLFIPSRH